MSLIFSGYWTDGSGPLNGLSAGTVFRPRGCLAPNLTQKKIMPLVDGSQDCLCGVSSVARAIFLDWKGDEQIAAKETDFVFDRACFVPRVGVTEGNLKPVVSLKAAKEVG